MKKMIAAAVAGLASVLLFSGCTNVKDLNNALGEASPADKNSTPGLRICKNKTTQSDVLENIGTPSITFVNDKGGSTWFYSRIAVRNTQSGGKASDKFAVFFPFKAGMLSGDAGCAGANASVVSQRASCKTASLIINFNKSGMVINYEYPATCF